MTRGKNPYIEDGVERLRTKWPQTNYEKSRSGAHLIIVPSVILPKGYRETICTVLFEAPPGFPAAHPENFYTDIEIRLADGSIPHYTLPFNEPFDFVNHHGIRIAGGGYGNFPGHIWPAWRKCMWWKWRVQMWNPNHSSLYTYIQVIRQRLEYVK
jgi:hypothetical protein